MPYIVVPIDFFEKDKRMRKLMFRFEEDLLRCTIALVSCCARAPRDGTLANDSTEALELALGWTGRRGELGRALIEAKFLRKCRMATGC